MEWLLTMLRDGACWLLRSWAPNGWVMPVLPPDRRTVDASVAKYIWAVYIGPCASRHGCRECPLGFVAAHGMTEA